MRIIERWKTLPEHLRVLTLWFALFFYYESSIRLINHRTFFTSGLLFGLLFDGVFAVVLTLITFAFKSRKSRNRILMIEMGIVTLLFITQMVYFKLTKTYYTAYSAGNTGKVMEFADIGLSAVLSNWYFILVFLLPAFLFGYFKYKKKLPTFETVERISLKTLGLLLVVAVMLQFGGRFSLNFTSKDDNSAYSLYYNIQYPEFSVERLGLPTYMRIDLQRVLFDWEPKLSYAVEEVAVEIPTIDEIIETTDATKEATTESTTEATEAEYNALDINFQDLINQETDETLLEMHQYFNAVEPSEKNALTGKYEGYNLILITAEGFSRLAVSESFTPTLYKMMHEGVYFDNFYTPLWGVSTSDGEYVATTSLVPKSGVWSYKESSDNAMIFALGNQLRNLGYTTKAYHDHTYTYYDRHLSHPNMGYDYKGVGNGLNLTPTWPESDEEMMAVTVPEYISEQPFHTYYMTVSGHMFYDFNGNAMSYKHYDLVKDLPYSEHVKAYLACQYELELAMKSLLEQLKAAGELDHTLIALSADHYPYGLTIDEMSELAGHDIEENFELYKNAFILYTPSMTPSVYSEPASSLDILPTLSNLLGLPYDSRLLMGRDLFSSTPALVMFNNRSFITDEGRYNSNTGEFIREAGKEPLDEETLEVYRKKISSIINAKFYFSAKILDMDYYRILEPFINEKHN